MADWDKSILYAPIEPFRSGRLEVSGGHQIYYEQCGNPSGKPVLVVHGGPGGGSNPTMRRFHDPARHHIILFDQRGCGRSLPNASLDNNTTWDLVDDMEAIRRQVGVNRWQLFGGSWGSTLSLAYAQTHPERVTELVLRGIFLMRPEEIRWFYQDGVNWIYPDAFADLLKPIPPAERSDLVAAYHKRLTHPDRKVQLEAARAWSIYEASTMSLRPDADRLRMCAADSYALAFARIECHYFVNGGFLKRKDQLLADAGPLHRIPGTIVHGRYDVVTPLKNAFDLKAVWSEADLRIVPAAGHAMTEPAIMDELVAATRRYSGRGA
jgi:proline iminopeptidase